MNRIIQTELYKERTVQDRGRLMYCRRLIHCWSVNILLFYIILVIIELSCVLI